jgi:hypothetical protein
MDVCDVCFKQRQKGKMQDKETSADEVQTEYKRIQKKNPVGGMYVCLV